jgi:hypothetical protein
MTIGGSSASSRTSASTRATSAGVVSLVDSWMCSRGA